MYPAPDINTLPKFACVRHIVTRQLVLVERGVVGFWRIEASQPEDYAEIINRDINVPTLEAMKLGCVFGFDKPCANPLNHQGKA